MLERRVVAVSTWIMLGGILAVGPGVWAVQPGGRHAFPERRFGPPFALLRELDLSENQRDQLRAIAEQGMSSGSFAHVMEQRRALDEAVENGADEGTIRQIAYEYGMAEGEAAVERARMQSQMMEILTPEQREQYETFREERKKEMEKRRERFNDLRQRRRE